MLLIFAVVSLIIVLIAAIRYPPISLVLLLLVGVFKGILIAKFGFLRFLDLTAICSVLVLFFMMYTFVRHGESLKDIISIPLFLYLFLAAFLLSGLMYTSAPNYGFSKSSRFATIVFVMFFAPVVLAHTMEDVKLIIWVVFIVGIMYSIGTVIAPHTFLISPPETMRARFLDVGPLRTGGAIAMGATIAFCFAITPYTSRRAKFLSMALIPLMFIGIVLTGSRGPFFGLAFCILTALVIYRKHVPKIWALAIFAATLFAVLLVLIKLPERSTIRIIQLFEGREAVEKVASSRTERITWILENMNRHPIIGNGTGAYAIDRYSADIMEYPHNIILEVLYEQGLIGVVILSLFLWLIFRRWRQASKLARLYRPGIGIFQIVHIAGLLFLFTLLQAMKSFDISGNRLMFFSAGVVLAAYKCIRNECLSEPAETEAALEDWNQSEYFEEQSAVRC